MYASCLVTRPSASTRSNSQVDSTCSGFRVPRSHGSTFYAIRARNSWPLCDFLDNLVRTAIVNREWRMLRNARLLYTVVRTAQTFYEFVIHDSRLLCNTKHSRLVIVNSNREC